MNGRTKGAARGDVRGAYNVGFHGLNTGEVDNLNLVWH